ncbi:hypothetical protein M565_ctg1P0224 [Vibrio cyclitrophicus FF75]|nr:hypothetical protein M565_ctg1P0224 [Vibrio cyclitrophicus FF75]
MLKGRELIKRLKTVKLADVARFTASFQTHFLCHFLVVKRFHFIPLYLMKHLSKVS